MSVYVGIDVHRKRSQVAVVAEDGQVRVNRNVVNGVEPILKLIGDLPNGTPVAFEAAYGWGWLVALLEDYGFAPHMVHPLRCKAIASARLKNDRMDAATLAQLLRADLLPEAWIAPLEVRQLRALLRHRVALVRLGTGLRNRIHAVAADHGYDRPGSYWTGAGRSWLVELPLPAVSRQIIIDSLAFIDALAPTIEQLDRQVHTRVRNDPRVKVLTALPGVGFPAPDYYGASAPHGALGRRRPCPSSALAARGEGGTGRFPRSSSVDRRARRPALPLRYRHGYAADIHRGLLAGNHMPAKEFSTTRRQRMRTATSPYPPDLSWWAD
jgi:transposase